MENPDMPADQTSLATPIDEVPADGATPATFDIAGFAEGFGIPTDVVPLYRRLDLVEKLTEAQIALADARAMKDVQEGVRLSAQVKALAEQVRDDRIMVKLRSLSMDRMAEIRAEAATLGIKESLRLDVYQTAQQVVEPQELADYETLWAVGERTAGQVFNLMRRAAALNAMVEPPTVPFS